MNLLSTFISSILNQLIIFLYLSTVNASWDLWWTYDGISGPNYWGKYNVHWKLCNKGRKQSPIDIRPELLLYDPFLPSLILTGSETSGHLINTGKGLVFRVQSDASASFQLQNSVTDSKHHNQISPHHKHSSSNIETSAQQSNNLISNSEHSQSNSFHKQSNSLDSMDQLVNSIELNGGPLAYSYSLSHLSLHYGRDEMRGSEHTIAGIQFPGEFQFIFYNSQLYSSYDEAQNKAHGLAAIAVMIQISDSNKAPNPELKKLVQIIQNITIKGSIHKIEKLLINDLLPAEHLSTYCTYEGSITTPACYETVQWLILNKPIYLTASLFGQLRLALHLDESSRSADNFRPKQKLNNRTIRTNIEFKPYKSSLSSINNQTTNSLSNELNTMNKPILSCSMRKQMYYKANLKSFGDENLIDRSSSVPHLNNDSSIDSTISTYSS